MRYLNKLKPAALLAALYMVATPAMAEGVSEDDPFAEFAEMAKQWAGGGLGTGIALLTLLVGAGIGVARNSPLPALSGVASAAFLKWGPDIVTKLLGTGALV